MGNINIRKQAINEKLQGSVATYLGCSGVISNQIKNGFLLSFASEIFFKSMNIWQSYKQKRCCLVQNYGHEFVALLFWPTLYIGEVLRECDSPRTGRGRLS